eukprot:scaffold12362_cov124-Isochrysis_galbana.AAC.8
MTDPPTDDIQKPGCPTLPTRPTPAHTHLSTAMPEASCLPTRHKALSDSHAQQRAGRATTASYEGWRRGTTEDGGTRGGAGPTADTGRGTTCHFKLILIAHMHRPHSG